MLFKPEIKGAQFFCMHREQFNRKTPEYFSPPFSLMEKHQQESY
jgi:hypothetical protein